MAVDSDRQDKSQKIDLPNCSDELMWEVFLARFQWPTLTVAEEFGVFSLLSETPLSAEKLAKEIQISPRTSEAMLAVLASLGFVVQRSGEFHLTEVSKTYLLPDSKYYRGGHLALLREQAVTHTTLKEAILQDVTSAKHGTDQWSNETPDPEKLKKYTSMIHASSLPSAMGLAASGRVSGIKKLLDVAGGSGCFSIALARHDPELHCTVMELPPVCDVVDTHIIEQGLEKRVRSLAADMFTDPWPSNCDGVFFSNVFHDWDLERCLCLAKKSFEALPSGGRVFIHEQLMYDTLDGPLTTALFSMNMIWVTAGKQYSGAEIIEILMQAGFTDISVDQAYALFSIVSATKP